MVCFFATDRQLRELRSSSMMGRGSGRGSVGSLSPNLSSSGSPQAPNRSPAGIKRRPASFHARTPRTPRPNDLKVTPFSRMLNPPTSVDSLPRLRRFTSSHCQLSSFAYLGHEERPGEKKDSNTETAAQEKAGTSHLHRENKGEHENEQKQTERARSKGEDRQRRSAEVLQQPLPENKRPTSSLVKAENQDRRDLVEVPLSGLKPAEGSSSGQEMEGEEDGDDQKACCGFFFKVNKTFKMLIRLLDHSCSSAFLPF